MDARVAELFATAPGHARWAYGGGGAVRGLGRGLGLARSRGGLGRAPEGHAPAGAGATGDGGDAGGGVDPGGGAGAGDGAGLRRAGPGGLDARARTAAGGLGTRAPGAPHGVAEVGEPADGRGRAHGGAGAGGAVTVAHAAVGELPFSGLPAAVRAGLPEFAAPRRRGTYAAGRLAAARATAALTGAPHWPLPGERGAPGWPRGVRGSLTHTDELALCAVTATDGLAIGLDMEPLASADGLYAARRYAATPAELARVRAARRPDLAVLRLFCAKEALYKALPVARQEGLAFRSVTLEWTEPAPTTDAPVLLSVSAAEPAPAALRGATARCRVVGDHMVAAVTLTVTPTTTDPAAPPHPAPAARPGHPPRARPTAPPAVAYAPHAADSGYPTATEPAPGPATR
ncbi:4'-phosphopantetheinyl transferase superfamily protein [Streptomyces sp. NPDC057702]|uniref:4'-phosphopantetheinyl transferase superfamily protein n=1 Tax=unclassified Streptomyces TaxID=2593676 RepID=UPI00367FF09A